jgi:hypothetical protein
MDKRVRRVSSWLLSKLLAKLVDLNEPGVSRKLNVDIGNVRKISMEVDVLTAGIEC